MQVDLRQAVKMFYSQSSYENIYQEAVANALDAGAYNISIFFEAKELSDEKSFRLVIEDDGVGFTDERYRKFSKLMNIDEGDISHRGLGRLVYLFYYDKVVVKSHFEGNKYREFSFNEKLDGSVVENWVEVEECKSNSILEFSGYNLTKLKNKSFADPEWIKGNILKKFVSRLFQYKHMGMSFSITITSKIGNRTNQQTITPDSIPELTEWPFASKYSTLGDLTILYSILKTESVKGSVITGISIDDRNEPIEIFADESIPAYYDMIFLLSCDAYQGCTDATRQSIKIPDDQLKVLQHEIRDQVLKILEKELPEVVESNKKQGEQLAYNFPHLSGYFDINTIGIRSKNEVISNAQTKFFKAQRECLLAPSSSTENIDNAIDIAGRAMTEYILFRQQVIEKLKQVDTKDREDVIHNLIVPKREILYEGNFAQDIYKNNVWLFDDKFMTYNKILSERETTDLLTAIDLNFEQKDINRPDIAIIFSDDPSTSEMVDLVIVELKRKGLKPGENMKVEYQLEQRARAIYPLYGGKIQSVWLYGVTSLDNEYKSTLSTMGYSPLYSKGTSFINTAPIVVDWENGTKVPAVRHIMDIDSVINDADARNYAFLQLIRSKFKI